ncbi:hypothetical protein GCM10029964_030510 [Kibdelosporangium lantanae]
MSRVLMPVTNARAVRANFDESVTAITRRADAMAARLMAASARSWAVRPLVALRPQGPMMAVSNRRLVIDASARGPVNASSPGRGSPPASSNFTLDPTSALTACRDNGITVT